jgi:hypothetical protein
MLMTATLLLIGAAIVWLTLRDVFETVVVPGGSRALLRVAHRVVCTLLPIWRRLSRGNISRNFAPFALFVSFVIWVALLAVGFGMMVLAVGHSINPPVNSLAEGVYVAMSSMGTLGVGTSVMVGGARWVVTAAAFCGLAVITLAVTYLLEVQTSISKRDTGIFKLKTAAGDPPSALELLERYGALGTTDMIGGVLGNGRDWCVTVRQSHVSHPSLIYFRTVGTGAGWPASLGTLLDLALIYQFLVDAPDQRGLAILLRADGLQMAEDLATVIGLEPLTSKASASEFEQLRQRLSEAGYPLQPDPNFDALVELRQNYAGWVEALAKHLGSASAPLLSC